MMLTRRALLSSAAGAAALAGAPGLALARAAGPSGGATPRPTPCWTPWRRRCCSTIRENASFLGMDSGPRAGLKRRLTDRLPRRRRGARAASCAERLGRLKAVDRSRLSGLPAVSYDATLYGLQRGAADGYAAFKFRRQRVLNDLQAESNTPYVVNQSTGDFSAIPDFLDSQHKIETAADADAYLERMQALAVGLDAETERVRHDAAQG